MSSSRDTLSRPLYALLFAITLMTAVGNLGLVSVMPAIGRALAIPDALIACTFSLSALCWAFTAPVWALRSDRAGRKAMLLLGLGGFSGSMAGCALVVIAGLHHLAAPLAIFAAFTLVRSSYGLVGSAAAPAAQAFVADRTHGMERVRALSGLAAALSLGTILGPAVAPFFVLPPMGLAGPPVAFAVAGLCLMVGVGVGLPHDRPPPAASGNGARQPSLWRDPRMRPLLAGGLLIASCQAINIYTLGFALIDTLHGPLGRAQWWIGITMSLGAVSGLVAQIGVVNLLRPSPMRMLWSGAALAAIGNLIAMAHPGLAAPVIGFVVMSFGYGLARPGFSAAASMAVGPERQGAVAGAVASIAGASIAVPPILAVALYQYWWSAPFVLAAAGSAWVALSSAQARPLFPQGD